MSDERDQQAAEHALHQARLLSTAVTAARLVSVEARLAAAEARIASLEATQPNLTLTPRPTQPPPHPTNTIRDGPPPYPYSTNTIRGGPLSYPPPPHPGWRPVLHKQPSGCGETALYLTRFYHRAERANLEDMRVGLQLEKPRVGEQATCASCNQPIDPFTSADLDWTLALTDEPTVTVVPPPSDAQYEPPFGADPTGRIEAMQDAIHRARDAGISV